MRSVLVVDDEAPARARLRRLLGELGGWTVVGEAAHGAEALELCQMLDPELLLLDIRMPGMDGLELAHHLLGLPRPPAIIFTTAYDDYAIEAFEAQAIGYLLKPVRRDRLERALEQAARLSRSSLATAAADSGQDRPRSHICIRKTAGLRLVPVEDILGFRAEKKYVMVMLADGEELSDETLKGLETEFPGRLIRIHRNTLIAKRHLQRMERGDDGQTLAWLAGREEPLAVSRRLAAGVRRELLRDGS